MILPVHERLRAHLQQSARAAVLPRPGGEAPAIPLEYPPTRDLGDLGTPVAFELARRLRKAPRAIAQEIAGSFGTSRGSARVAAAPNGYLNFFLERRGFLMDRLGAQSDSPRDRAGRRRSSSTRRSIRTRPRTSAICAIRRSATRSSACCGFAAFRSRSRTTSTIPASRWPTSSSGSWCSSESRSTRSEIARPSRRASTTTAGTSTRASPSGTRTTRRG